MHELAPLIRDLAIILGVAGLVTLLFQKIRQPVVLGYLVAGVIIGPYTPPYVLVTDIPNIKVLAELGVVFLMFSLGLDFSFHKLRRVGLSASVTGVIEVVLMLLVGFATGQLLGWSFNDSIFLGAALSISSTTIILKALEELNLKNKRFADLVFGVLIVEDLLAILLLVGLSTVVMTANIFSTDMLWAAAKLILVVGSWFLIGYFLVPPLFRKVMVYISSETLTIVSIALCLLLVWLASYFNYSVALGAFIMGSILAETREVHRIETLVRPIRDIFAAVFFVSVGMLIDPKMIFAHWPIILLLSLVTIFGKIITSALGAFLTGQSFNTSLRVGFSLAQIGEFSFIIAGLGLALGATSNALYPIIVAVSAVTTFATPYLIRLSGTLSETLETKLSSNTKYFLESYSTWLYRIRADRKHRPLFRNAIIRFVVNGIIVASIFSLSQNFLVPELEQLLHQGWLIKVVGWLVAVIISAPFIWAMLFAFKINTNQKSYLFPPMILPWIITIAEVSLLSLAYFDTWIIMGILLIIALSFFLLLYNQLEKYYHWFENRLIANIRNLEEFSHAQFEELAPWDTHLVQLIISHDSPLVGKTLEECQLRQEFGINIVAIHRGAATILAPRGNQRLLPDDKLIVLGDDEQIDRFKNIAEKTLVKQDNNYSLENFVLKTRLLDAGNPQIGKSIRDSQIREKTNGLVVGLERNGVRILNPDPGTILQDNDLLFVVGEAHSLEKL